MTEQPDNGQHSAPQIDPDLIADALLVDPEEEYRQQAVESIETLLTLVGPILNELFRNAALGKDMWLKKKSVEILSNWIQTAQDTSTLMMRQLEAAEQVIAAQEKELEELRPEKSKVWTPFAN